MGTATGADGHKYSWITVHTGEGRPNVETKINAVSIAIGLLAPRVRHNANLTASPMTVHPDRSESLLDMRLKTALRGSPFL